MVTKQQQLEWLAEKWTIWHHPMGKVFMSRTAIGDFVRVTGNPHLITREEWQQERDKMKAKPEVDNSWFGREELPPCGVPVELWFGGVFAYNCEFLVLRGDSYVVWNLDADRPDCADRLNTAFRPLRTEREKAIEEMSRLMHEHGSVINDTTLGALYDAGYRKMVLCPSPI